MSFAHKANGKAATRRKSPFVVRSIAAAIEAQGNGEISPPFKMPKLAPPVFPDRQVDIRDHGATPEKQGECTRAIADAIDACAKAGGGRVVIPAGRWLTGPIHLKSNIDLHLADGAQVRFSSE